MSYSTWTPLAVSSESFDWQNSAWRMVEAQHVASTMKIVDNQAEQNLLEVLLEASKPAQPNSTQSLDYWLSTPFRYNPVSSGSRFRSVTDPGVFYGAESVRTASAELGYWRWKFLKDAVDLIKLEPVAHTAFRVEISACVIDLRKPPFDSDASVWVHPTDYGPTQSFAQLAREASIEAIIYQSVRDPDLSWCIALLTPAAFLEFKPHQAIQTWWLTVHQNEIIWRPDKDESMTFSCLGW